MSDMKRILLGINYRMNDMHFSGHYSVLFNSKHIGLNVLIIMTIGDLIGPILQSFARKKESFLINKLEESAGKILIYFDNEIHVLDNYEEYWKYVRPGQTMKSTEVYIEDFYLQEEDEFETEGWKEVYNLHFDHSNV